VAKKELFNNLTTKKLLTKNILWNFLAQGLPLIIALFTIPFIIKGMGVDRFSLLTLIWVIIGYSNLFDFGLGRALTQLISKKLATSELKDIPALIWTGLTIVFCFGIVATIVVWLLTPFIVNNILRVPVEYKQETTWSLYALALTLPMLLLIVNIKGILEAYQRFFVISLLRLPVVLFNYIGPLFVLPFSNDLFHIVLLLVAGRIITFIFYIIACLKIVKELTSNIRLEKSFLKPLFSFGSWITISNIIGPIMSYMDRFFLAYLISALVVAYYTTPFDIISRLSIVPLAIIGVMFPAFSAEFQVDRERTRRLYLKTSGFTALLLLIPIILIIIFAKAGLTFWLDADFAEASYRITQVIALAVFIEAVNQSPLALIQGTGRADITGKIILAVLPIYIFFLLLFINWYGLIGAAFAGLIRAILDAILLNIFARRLLKTGEFANE
jgi:O-antigen/teichoic acid export membrane protein